MTITTHAERVVRAALAGSDWVPEDPEALRARDALCRAFLDGDPAIGEVGALLSATRPEGELYSNLAIAVGAWLVQEKLEALHHHLAASTLASSAAALARAGLNAAAELARAAEDACRTTDVTWYLGSAWNTGTSIGRNPQTGGPLVFNGTDALTEAAMLELTVVGDLTVMTGPMLLHRDRFLRIEGLVEIPERPGDALVGALRGLYRPNDPAGACSTPAEALEVALLL